MESLVIVLIGLPFLSALLLSIFKNNTVRQIVTYVSSIVIIGLAVTFSVKYFVSGADSMSFFSQTEIADYAMIAAEAFLMVLITVLSIKYKQYYAAALSIVQTVLMFWYELGGYAPHQVINKIYIDQLTVIMVLIVAIIGTLITVYACGYMKDYHNHHKEFKDRRRYFFLDVFLLGNHERCIFPSHRLYKNEGSYPQLLQSAVDESSGRIRICNCNRYCRSSV